MHRGLTFEQFMDPSFVYVPEASRGALLGEFKSASSGVFFESMLLIRGYTGQLTEFDWMYLFLSGCSDRDKRGKALRLAEGVAPSVCQYPGCDRMTACVRNVHQQYCLKHCEEAKRAIRVGDDVRQLDPPALRALPQSSVTIEEVIEVEDEVEEDEVEDMVPVEVPVEFPVENKVALADALEVVLEPRLELAPRLERRLPRFVRGRAKSKCKSKSVSKSKSASKSVSKSDFVSRRITRSATASRGATRGSTRGSTRRAARLVASKERSNESATKARGESRGESRRESRRTIPKRAAALKARRLFERLLSPY